jgi:crossover junction endodeoxyribonuclease RuvC
MGVGVVDSAEGDMSLVYSNVLAPGRRLDLAERLHVLHTNLLEVIKRWRPEAVAVEEPFASRNIHSAMAIGQSVAVAMIAAASNDLPVHSYEPRRIKQAVTDYGGSSKEQVQDMVQALLGLPERLESFDAADAVAVAICHIHSGQARELPVLD